MSQPIVLSLYSRRLTSHQAYNSSPSKQASDPLEPTAMELFGYYAGVLLLFVVAVAMAVLLYLLVKRWILPFIYSFYASRQKEMKACPNNDSIHIQPANTPSFSHEDLVKITDGFSQQHFIGERGYGAVYRGQLENGNEVAVKQLKAGSSQGEKEFKAEVEIISKIHRRNLVKLVGYCAHKTHRTLVYSFEPNKTLAHHLHGEGMPSLNWETRMRIARGAACGLEYLHEYCHQQVIHRDIKSTNIVLDNDFNAKVADFGLAKIIVDTETQSTRIKGTNGYISPEYAACGKLTKKADVYSFGVLMIEIVTGRKALDTTKPPGDNCLAEWARPLLDKIRNTHDFTEVVDPRLGNFNQEEMLSMISVGFDCICWNYLKRPSMSDVVKGLWGESGNQQRHFGSVDSVELDMLSDDDVEIESHQGSPINTNGASEEQKS